jgi:hypothetical protein
MGEGVDGVGRPSRRSFLKTGTAFALIPSVHLAALDMPREEQPGIEAAKYPADPSQPASPEWMKDLVIYEIATRGFTSPNGPESGTFAGLKGKLPYLQDLGVTGIWLAGYSVCDPHHFYNIWTQYAVIEPDAFDPALGTAEEFKSLIDGAHSRGIKVFLDVITHGVMKDSPLIRQHPSWFRGGSWGMTDYDWTGGHLDLDEWWVRIHADFVTRYGVDGFRLDVDTFRPDLWERIRRKAAATGHPIVIWEETSAAIRGVTDFSQHDSFVTEAVDHRKWNEVVASDMPGFYDRKYGRGGDYAVEVHYQDCEVVKGNTKSEGAIGVHLAGLSESRVGRRIGEFNKPDGLPNVKLVLDNIARKPIDNIIVRSDADETWALRPADWAVKPLFVDVPDSRVAGPKVDVYFATLSWGPSIQLSCHDNGWEGFPLDKNPYVAQGSRSIYGYSFLFTPMIPVFFAGEEFDANFHPLPWLSPHLYGGKEAGRGRWLYGSMLDWNELNEPRHKDMFEDVRRMISIRKQNADVMAMTPGGIEPKLKAVKHTSTLKVPVPYLRWSNHAAVLIAANRSREQDAAIQMTLNLAGTPIDGHERYTVSDLWSGSGTKTYTTSELKLFECAVKRDGTRGGGLAVFTIDPS